MEDMKKLKNRQEKALQRYRLISPLLAEDMDIAKKTELRKKIAKERNLSIRTLRRYEAAYASDGFSALMPENKDKRNSVEYESLLQEACALKREVPTRSVSKIILILELEGQVAPGVLKRSTLQRHLQELGYGTKQLLKKSEGAEKTASRRFCKAHRMELAQADIKYGVGIMIGKGDKKVTAYLSSILDDHSRHVLASAWFANMEQYTVTEIFRKCIQTYGKVDAFYCDNGSQYVASQLEISCAMLGIKVKHAAVRACQSKGKVEKYHQVVDAFITEAKLKRYSSLKELNEAWQAFLDVAYENVSHEGIREYYKSLSIDVPAEGITPLQEFNRDRRPLTFFNEKDISNAFMYHDTRTVDKGACISFEGRKYEVSTALIGAKVSISYDPANTEVITVHPEDMEPFQVHPVVIGSYCPKKPKLPETMEDEKPKTSRLLDAALKKHAENQDKANSPLVYRNLVKDEEEK